MAIIKHLSSKNADYGRALEYLTFQHNEKTQKPILDANGNRILREEYIWTGSTAIRSLLIKTVNG